MDRLTPNTEIEIALRGHGASVDLKDGDLQLGGATGADGKEVRVRTGSSTVGVRNGRVAVQSKDGNASVAVGEGEARVEGGPTVGARSAADLPKDGPPVVRPRTEDEKRRLTSDRFVVRPADDLVYIPAGTYRLGGDPGRGGGWQLSNESESNARLDGFLIGRTKVSHADYLEFVTATGAKWPEHLPEKVVPDDLRNRAITWITWSDGLAFARWCGLELPTVAQWEAAARGPLALVLPWGGEPPPDRRVSEDPPTIRSAIDDVPKYLRTLPALDEETRDRSPFGVLGLVTLPCEYCKDWIEDTKYVPGIGNGHPSTMPAPQTHRVMRGWATRWIVPSRPGNSSSWWGGIRLVRQVK